MTRLTGSIVAIAGAATLVALGAIPAAGHPSTLLGVPRAAAKGQPSTLLRLRQAAVEGQAPAGRALSRTADGKPDFSGIWEVMSKANYNIEPHSASRSVPAGAGVVEGGELPAARARRSPGCDNNVETQLSAVHIC